ncbi:hypothetical protein ACVJGD_002340 [Bradyrhizobium sp. USDA 10063]
MKWMKERDLLIAQTMAFVQSVTGKKPEAELLSPATETTVRATMATTVVNVEAVLAEPPTPIPVAVQPKPPQPKPLQVAGLDLPGDFQSEIRARVASFRAHQERFIREREEYCRATMAKVRATLSEGIEPPRSTE